MVDLTRKDTLEHTEAEIKGFADEQVQNSLDPTQMSDELATKLGFKQYLADGTTYNNGLSIGVTGTNFTLSRGVYIPYLAQDGTWRCKFNFRGSVSSPTTSLTLTTNNLVFKNDTEYKQAVVTATGNAWSNGNVSENTGSVVIYTSGSRTNFRVSGDVELESKPDWAY